MLESTMLPNVHLAGKSPNIWLFTVLYTVLASPYQMLESTTKAEAACLVLTVTLRIRTILFAGRALQPASATTEPWRVLDLGVGTGPNFKYFIDFNQQHRGGDLAKPALQVIGLDRNPAMFEPYARQVCFVLYVRVCVCMCVCVRECLFVLRAYVCVCIHLCVIYVCYILYMLYACGRLWPWQAWW
jgi:SAM-dependent methyltransferase